MPAIRGTPRWRCLLDTARPQMTAGEMMVNSGDDLQIDAWAVAVLALMLEEQT
jgi:hypothetical protein